MEDETKTKEQLLEELLEMRRRMSELDEVESQRKQAPEALKDSEERFRVLYNNSPDMYASVSPDDASILLCNETLLKKTGYPREEIIGFPIFKMYHDDCMDEVKKAFQQFVETGTIQDKELVLKRKDGSQIDVSLNVNAAKDETGKILHSISSWRDITERKQAEEALKESRQFFSGTLNNLMTLIAVMGIDGTLVFVNDTALNVWRIPLEDAIGTMFCDMSYGHTRRRPNNQSGTISSDVPLVRLLLARFKDRWPTVR
ncbi:MAG: PAS domain S-box protein [Chloroflexota bacterium]|nr:PAS domain S-box protein [Chloroflexota bacterium]